MLFITIHKTMKKIILNSIILLSLSKTAFANLEIQKNSNYFENLNEDFQWFKQKKTEIDLKDTRGLFLRIYHTVTKEMPNMFKENQFENPIWVNKLMLKYVGLYRNALECDANKNCFVSPAWEYAFYQNELNRYSPSIQLLFSISAHVNRDLPIALAQINTNFNDESLHRDFKKIAQIFIRRMPELIDNLKQYQKCKIGKLDFKLTNKVIMRAMKSTREQSWEYGKRLSNVKNLNQENKLLDEIEQHTKKEMNLIKRVAPIGSFTICL